MSFITLRYSLSPRMSLIRHGSDLPPTVTEFAHIENCFMEQWVLNRFVENASAEASFCMEDGSAEVPFCWVDGSDLVTRLTITVYSQKWMLV